MRFRWMHSSRLRAGGYSASAILVGACDSANTASDPNCCYATRTVEPLESLVFSANSGRALIWRQRLTPRLSNRFIVLETSQPVTKRYPRSPSAAQRQFWVMTMPQRGTAHELGCRTGSVDDRAPVDRWPLPPSFLALVAFLEHCAIDTARSAKRCAWPLSLAAQWPVCSNACKG